MSGIDFVQQSITCPTYLYGNSNSMLLVLTHVTGKIDFSSSQILEHATSGPTQA